MKKVSKLLTVFLTVILSSLSAVASTSTTVLEFTLNDFNIRTNSKGQVSVSGKSLVYWYHSGPDDPALSFYNINIPLAPNSTVKSISARVDKKSLIMRDATIAPAPVALPTSESGTSATATDGFSGEISPATTIKYVGSLKSYYGDVAFCSVCPFIYESVSRQLYLSTKLTIIIEYEYIAVEIPKDYYNPSLKETINDLINVPFDPSVPTFLNKETGSNVKDNSDNWDYVIITSEKLKKSFEPLRNIKTVLGVRTKLLTVEEISKKYREGDLQSKIKRQIKALYQDNDIEYVLLGGDITEVPTRECFIKFGTLKSSTPADNYFVCFEGSFDWDKNNNKIYGELEDSVDFFTPLYISRLPVDTTSKATGYIRKLISYQMEGNTEGNYDMLMSGMYLWKNINHQSDAYWKADTLYKEAIKGSFSGDRKLLFDTYTNLKFNNEFNFCADNIQTALSTGYSFVDVMTHGEPTYYTVEYGSPYSTENASKLKNKGYSIITTMACFTNAFDNKSDPCLSEAFIRNADSGVLAYFGSSRQGWGYDGDYDEEIKLGPSLQYEAEFYKNLFMNDSDISHNFAKCATDAKLNKTADCFQYTPFRWLQFSLNPIGDPELPIYTTQPESIKEPKLDYSNGILTVAPVEDNTNITVTSLSDYGESFYESVKNSSNEIDFPKIDFSVAISLTRPGYLPAMYVGTYTAAANNIPAKMVFSKLDHTKFLGRVPATSYGGSIEYVYSIGSEMKIGVLLDESSDYNEIIVSDLMGNVKARRSLTQEEEIQTLSVEVEPGFHCVSLFTDGQFADQKKYLVK